MGQSNYIHLEGCDILRETESAFLIRYGEEEYWIPFTQIATPDTYDEGDEDVTVSITEWIANKKGIEIK